MNKILLIFSFLLFSHTSFSQSGWFWQNPLPQGNDLYAMKILDANRALAGGENGTILRTTNGGNNWTIVRQDSGYVYRTFYFFDSNTGFVGGKLNLLSYLLKTTDGGLNWITFCNFPMGNIYCVEFTDVNTGYVVGSGISWGLVYKTTNAGTNWNIVYSTNNTGIYTCHFVNNITGFVGGNIGLIKTTDGGSTWSASPFNYVTVNSISFTDNNTGFIVGLNSYPFSGQVVSKTTNCGINWIILNGIGNSGLYCVDFLNSYTGIATGSSLIMKTTNGGTNWLNATPITGFSFNAGRLTSLGLGFVVSDMGLILKTSNYGSNWIDLFPSIRNYNNIKLRFSNRRIGYACNEYSIFKTTNNGANWISIFTISNTPLNDIAVVDSNIIYAVGGNQYTAIFLKSTNGGLNWVQLNTGLNGDILSVYFLNANLGYCVNLHNVIKTTDGGNSWNIRSDASGYCIHFPDVNTGYVGGYLHSYKTSDAGNTWNPLPAGASSIAESIYFLNSDTGFTGNRDCSLRKTQNGGTNWKIVTTGSGILYSIHFINAFTGYVVGENGTILKTTNGGEYWFTQPIPTTKSLSSVFMVDANTCYVGGSECTILCTTNGGVPIAVSINQKRIPKYFTLSQNYPNPFNPLTQITFSVPKATNVTLKVYDILGQEIALLVNERKQAGEYNVTWNAEGVTSGVYFYRIVAGGFIQTNKMVVVK